MRGYCFGAAHSLRSGRAIAQLAGLLGPAAAKPLWSAAFGGPATAPQPAGLSALGLTHFL
ncbi:hypothetical protein SGRA_0175 [Saprospira grandis str. Lewin]|uniref:Uncharacterized protein n=1 Tax=Saprospira grandis (strain Lewin) TaxID=984262 RepID=H6L544_SAPGL|nr:hypothetical protein SGRA_0175 [Saprospira grandis str. Lewin]